MKVLFITTQDIIDLAGNGGVKGSRKNYDLLNRIEGVNVDTCILRKKDYKYDSLSVIKINQPPNNMGELFVSLMGFKRMFPHDVSKIKKYVITNNIDILWVDSSLIGNLTALKKYCKVVVFFHNCEYDYSVNKVKTEGIKYIFSALSSKKNEKNATKADAIGCLNGRDSNRIKELYGRKADFFLPVTFDDVFIEDKVQLINGNNLLFIGSYFKPNVDSIIWFIENVMTQLPNYNLVIVGKGFESIKQEIELKYQNVRVDGTVEDLGQYYYSYPVLVMPILYGAGMKVKTAEAMMYGKTIIASDEALEGYEVDGVKGIFRCNTADEYISKIKLVFESKIQFQDEVRKLFLNRYLTDSLVPTVEKVIKEIKN